MKESNVMILQISNLMYFIDREWSSENMYTEKNDFMKKDKMVSIIVPIYNCEKLLERCITSIMKQTYVNIEIILINDGSSDESEKICLYFKSIDQRVKYIYQENRGVSIARNRGIAISQGKFIQFVDADDFLDTNSVNHHMKAFDETEDRLIISNYTYLTKENGKQKSVVNKHTLETGKLDFCDFDSLYFAHLFNSPCNKLYLKENIVKLFDETLSLGEDLLFNLNYSHKHGYYFINESTFTYYRDTPGSLTKIKRNSLLKDHNIVYLEIKNYIYKHKVQGSHVLSESSKNIFKKFILNLNLDLTDFTNTKNNLNLNRIYIEQLNLKFRNLYQNDNFILFFLYKYKMYYLLICYLNIRKATKLTLG